MMPTAADFRAWSGANLPATVPDALIQGVLDEAAAAVASEVGVAEAVLWSGPAAPIATGEVLRRASRLLARRNSPEGIAGVGEMGMVTVPARDVDSQRAVWQMQAILMVPEGVS